jgi:restriction endonuclease Mrr
MAIPDFQEIMLPLLKTLDDRKEHSLRQVIDTLTANFNLTVEEQHYYYKVDNRSFLIIGSAGRERILKKRD